MGININEIPKMHIFATGASPHHLSHLSRKSVCEFPKTAHVQVKIALYFTHLPRRDPVDGFQKNQNRLFGMAAMHAGFTQLQ